MNKPNILIIPAGVFAVAISRQMLTYMVAGFAGAIFVNLFTGKMTQPGSNASMNCCELL